jgi:hypothetical protein
MDNDLKAAILDAKYIDLIDLAGSLIAEFGDDPAQAAELAGMQQQALAAAVFRWAATDIDETIAQGMGSRSGAQARQQPPAIPSDQGIFRPVPVAEPVPFPNSAPMRGQGQPPQDMQMQTDPFGQGPSGPDAPTG